MIVYTDTGSQLTLNQLTQIGKTYLHNATANRVEFLEWISIMAEPSVMIDLCSGSPEKPKTFQPKVAYGLNKPPDSSPIKLELSSPVKVPYIPEVPALPVPEPKEPDLVSLSVNYTISGTPLSFPCKAYPSQVAIMAKVIKGLQEAQNCLLESPTGSGKTLALLCSSLAWQKVEKEKLMVQRAALIEEQKQKALERYALDGPAVLCTCPKREEPVKNEEANTAKPKVSTAGSFQDEDECSSDEDFKPARKKTKGIVYDAPDAVDVRPPEGVVTGVVVKSENVCTCGAWERQRREQRERSPNGDDEGVPTLSVPKIFYGTRTHKQISQVVRELKKTVYRDVKMTILGSREHSCIHPMGKAYKSKTEMCHDLLDPRKGAGCMFKANADIYMSSHSQLDQYGCPAPFDIEDLVTVGMKVKSCPYFSARTLMKSADLIFCPYNYLIDQQILESTQVRMDGNVVILDEAHNIEDTAREAASHTAEMDLLKKAAEDCRSVALAGRLREMHLFLEDFLVKLIGWVDSQADRMGSTGDYNQSSYSLSGLEAIASFSLCQITSEVFSYYKTALAAVVADMTAASSKREKAQELHMISAVTKIQLQGIELALGNLYANESSHVDYQISIVNDLVTAGGGPATSRGGWRGVQSDATSSWKTTLNFWCQNPAVAMRFMREATRSIILTSGTLAPTDSFSSELGVPFPVQFEANHIIGRSQVFIATTTRGPNNHCLNAQYKNADTYSFQDELGEVVLDTCRIVPHGVLCFLPSYHLMEKLQNRWEMTGTWSRLEALKTVFSEPRRANQLENVMDNFRRCVGMSGALMFAVHRGKVSEGIDFADDQARAVIAVGIPYPNFKDVRVELKRHYNDRYCKMRGLLSGSRWYDIQAYRALNQALGRCIRHKNDWGAIILVDDRFSKGPYYTQGLSKWIRNMLQTHPSYQSLRKGLTDFTTDRVSLMQIEAEEKLNSSK